MRAGISISSDSTLGKRDNAGTRRTRQRITEACPMTNMSSCTRSNSKIIGSRRTAISTYSTRKQKRRSWEGTYHLGHGTIQPSVHDGHMGPLGIVPIHLDNVPLLLVMIVRPKLHYSSALFNRDELSLRIDFSHECFLNDLDPRLNEWPCGVVRSSTG
jgi:hypothetical protein